MPDDIDCEQKLAAAREDNEFLRGLLRTIVDEVTGVYGEHSRQTIKAMSVAQTLLEGGKPDVK